MKSMRIGLVLATSVATCIIGTSAESSETQKPQAAAVKNEATPQKVTPATSEKNKVKSEKSEPAAKNAAPAWIHNVLGDKFVTADGSEVSSDKLAGKTVGIYFSAHWCPPCRRFTPMLVKTVNKLKKDGKDFEVVFVSLDQSKKDMQVYMTEAKMPWYALPFTSAKKQSLLINYSVRGIPALIVVDKDGKKITDNGRIEVMQKGDAAFNDWTSK